MKQIIALGGVTAILLSLTAQTFATDSMGMSMGTSMNSTTTMNGGMMKVNFSMKSTAEVSKYYGYTWSKDRAKLAKAVGITNYTGTARQNLMIRGFLLSLGKDSVKVGGQMMVRSQDIVDNAMRANNVTTVVAAVKAAGLVETLKSEGPFTVFAPNNAAFEKLPEGTVATLLKSENKSTLVNILTYHVVPGRYKTSDLTDGLQLTTVEGKMLTFKKDASGNLWINGVAMIETSNVISSNGVTHVIDTVLMPQ
jgi:uncharacterized surface protein with fasciclin (FAS1) repeats